MNRFCKYFCVYLSTNLLVEKTVLSFSPSYFFRVFIIHFLLTFIYPSSYLYHIPYFTIKTVTNTLRFVFPMSVSVMVFYSRLRCHAYSWAGVIAAVNSIIFSSLKGQSCEYRPAACVSTSILCVPTRKT